MGKSTMSPAHKYLKDAWSKKADEAGGGRSRRKRESKPQTEQVPQNGWATESANQTIQYTKLVASAETKKAGPAADVQAIHGIFNTTPRPLTQAERRAMLRLPKSYADHPSNVGSAADLMSTQKKVREDSRAKRERAKQELEESRSARENFYVPSQKMRNLLPEHVIESTVRANTLLQCPFDCSVTDLMGFKAHKPISGMQGAYTPVPLTEPVGERSSTALASPAEINEHVRRLQEKKKFLDDGAMEHLRKVTAFEMANLPEHQYQVFSRQFGLTQPYKIDEVTGRSKHPLPGLQGDLSPVPTPPFSQDYVPKQQWGQASNVLGSKNREFVPHNKVFRQSAEMQSWTTRR
jgi:hypothetical protein